MGNVICTKANKYKECPKCPHSIPHETEGASWSLDKCNKWGECDFSDKKVRCVTTNKD
jgi:hypothetical protein